MGDGTGRFRRSDRLLDSRDFRRVLRRGRRKAHRDLVVISTPVSRKPIQSGGLRNIQSSGSRLGITASRKVGGAVVRNRFKRRLRAWFRARRSDFDADIDLVVIARRSGASLSLAQLDLRLSKLLDLDPAIGWRASKTIGVPGG